jgi:hexosaminidase
MSWNIVFLPNPRQLIKNSGFFTPKTGQFIQIKNTNPQDLLFTAEQIKTAFLYTSQISFQLTASHSIPEDQIAIRMMIDPGIEKSPQAYQLSINPDQILITGSDKAGLFYGVQTLKQISSQRPHQPLPCLEITDWPDFPVRGVMLDISRDKVYQMKTLLMLVDELASWKINQIQLYTEHTFAYLGHEVVWRDASPITPEEILILDRYCQERYIELVPNQNSFGHLSRWLKHTQYQHLAETTQPVETPWGGLQIDPFSLSPVLPESLTFISGLYDQLLPNFSSNIINVGCDETFDIGAGKSKSAVDQKGKAQVYLDYLLSLYREVKCRDYTMQFWGDIVLEHPNLIPQLPKDVVALNWGYEANHPFDEESKAFHNAGVPFYVCPGTSSWNSIAGRVDNMILNIRNAAYYGLINGAVGLLNTDWGDNGHWQQLPISYPGLAVGAACAWSSASNNLFDLESVLNQIVFHDHSQTIGKILLEIGNAYKAWGLNLVNSSPLFWLLQEPADKIRRYGFSDSTPIHISLDQFNESISQLDQIDINRSDAHQIQREVKLTIQMLQHACKRALLLFSNDKQIQTSNMLCEILDIKSTFTNLWLKRNRPGGLQDSLARFNTITEEYKSTNGQD